MKEESGANTVQSNLAFINDHRGILRIKAKEVIDRMKKKVTPQYVTKIWRGDFKKYNNPLVLEIIQHSIDLIKENKAALTEVA